MDIQQGVGSRNTYKVTAHKAHVFCKVARFFGFDDFAQHLVNKGYRGRFSWEDTFTNLVPNAALDDVLEKYLKNGTTATAWYLGVTNNDPVPAAGDTMAGHGGWSEFTDYDEPNRQTWTPGTVSGQSVDNIASPATITSSNNGNSVGGAFLVDNNSKGGATGLLYSVAAFELGNKTLDAGETLDITGVFSSSSV